MFGTGPRIRSVRAALRNSSEKEPDMHVTKRVAFSLIFSLLSGSPVFAQTFQGGVRGTVQDSSGAAITTVKVILLDEGTGITRSTVTGNGGEYSFSAVVPATYTVSLEKP